MQISVSTWNYECAYRETADLRAAIEEITGDGLGVELWLGWLPDQGVGEQEKVLGRSNWDNLALWLEKAPTVSAHTALGEWNWEGLKQEIDLLHHVKGSRQGAILVIHPGTIGGSGEDGLLGRINMALDYAGGKAVVVALENGPLDFLRFARQVHGLKNCLDVGHAQAREAEDAPLVEFLEEFQNDIVELHLHEARPEGNHYTPGIGGRIPWEQFFATLARAEYRGIASFEIREAEPRERWREALRFLSPISRGLIQA